MSVQTQGAPQQKASAPPPQQSKRQFKVTYRPGPEDRAKTVWNGITFQANQPVVLSIDNKRHFVESTVPQQVETADGSYVTRTVTKHISMIELAKGNCHFEVEGFPRAVKPVPEGRKPHSPEEYRSWAQAWFASAGEESDDIQSPQDMLERWDDEEALRERIGAGEDDVAFLKPFFDQKVAALKKHMAVRYAKGDGGEM